MLGAAEPEEPVEVPLVPDRGGAVLGDAAEALALGEASADAEGEAGEAAPAAAGDGEARIVAVPGVVGVPLGVADVELEAGDAGAEPDDDEPELAPPPKLTLEDFGQVPVGGVSAELPAFWTTAPGSGKAKSVLSAVLHPLPILARNMAGKEASRLPKVESLVASYAVVLTSRFFEPPVTAMGAQFM